MRGKRRRVADVEEGESYYVSMTDMMVGVIFIFIIMLSYFALQFRSTTAALTNAKHPETAALLQTAGDLQPRRADVEVDYKANVLCVPETLLSAKDDASSSDKRCFSFDPIGKATTSVAIAEAQRELMAFIDSDLHDAGTPISGDTSGGSLTFKAEQLFTQGTADLSPDGLRIASQVAQTLARRLPCLAYGAASDDCASGDHKLSVVNVLSQTNLDAFTPEGQHAASLALQRSAAFHQALTAAQPVLASLRNAPAGQPGSQPLLRVASVGQSQEGASRAGEDQTVSIQFSMAN
jgi:hypothetical protein